MAETFKKVKKYHKGETEDALLSQWTSAETVELKDGTTLDKKMDNVITTTGGQIAHIGYDRFIAYPQGGQYHETTDKKVGYMKITLPMTFNNTMIKFVVSIFNYAANASVDYHIAGYTYMPNSTWMMTSTYINSAYNNTATKNLTVRFGHDGTNCCVYIGEPTTTWNYPKVIVRDVQIGHDSEANYANYSHGWSIGVTTTLGTITSTIIPTYDVGLAEKASQDSNGKVIADTYAKKASPTLTGTPKAPTASVGTNTTQIATTAFVQNAISNVGGITVDDAMSYTSTNPVQNKVINASLKSQSEISIAESLGWTKAPVLSCTFSTLSSGSVYMAYLPFGSGTYLVKMNNGTIYKVSASMSSTNGTRYLSSGELLRGEDVEFANSDNISTDIITGKRAFTMGYSSGSFVHGVGAPIVISTSPDVVAWYCDATTTVKDMITNSSAVTITGQYALDAVEKNASVSGTLANELGITNATLNSLAKTLIVNIPTGNTISFIQYNYYAPTILFFHDASDYYQYVVARNSVMPVKESQKLAIWVDTDNTISITNSGANTFVTAIGVTGYNI